MKALIIFCLIAVSWQLACENPLLSMTGNDLAPSAENLLNESAPGADNLTICTYLKG
jgi:hypothetical protein